MPRFRNTITGDVVTATGGNADRLAADERWEAFEPAAELKGAALDEALEEAGLPKSGKAGEKRARLAEAQA